LGGHVHRLFVTV